MQSSLAPSGVRASPMGLRRPLTVPSSGRVLGRRTLVVSANNNNPIQSNSTGSFSSQGNVLPSLPRSEEARRYFRTVSARAKRSCITSLLGRGRDHGATSSECGRWAVQAKGAMRLWCA